MIRGTIDGLSMVAAGVVGALVMAAIVRAGPGARAAKVPEVVEAKRFVLKDDEGRDRAILFMDGRGVHFTIQGPRGERQTSLFAAADGSTGLLLFDLDKSRNALVGLALTKAGSPELALTGSQGTISLRVNAQEGQKIYVFDEKKSLLFEAPPPK